MSADWSTYDEVAPRYGRFVAFNGYAALAADLVAELQLAPGAVVLDVGCGTGVVTAAMRARLGTIGSIAALDVSMPMVRAAVLTGVGRGIVATATGLPFRAASFDAVAASLVLSHLDSYGEAILELMRVLKPGGKLGVTAWAQGGSRGSPASAAWVSFAESVVGRKALAKALGRVAPHEDRFGDAAQLSAALEDGTNLDDLRIQVREYRIAMPLSDYLEMFAVFTLGRFVRASLGPSRWREFRREAEEKVRAACGERIEYTARYHIAVARKRSS